MSLELVPLDTKSSLLIFNEYIGKAIKFEYLDREGSLRSNEGIFRRYSRDGVYISLFNPLVPIKLRGVTISEGLEKYFPFSGEEALVRIVESRDRQFVNDFENIWGRVEAIINF